jgi:hypothetical protein
LFAFLFSIHIAHIVHVELIGVIFHEICLQGVYTECAAIAQPKGVGKEKGAEPFGPSPRGEFDAETD